MYGLTIIAILRTILNDYDYFIDKNPVIVKTPALQIKAVSPVLAWCWVFSLKLDPFLNINKI